MSTLPSFAKGQEDLIILFLKNFDRNGYFVDVGCLDPVNLSNTWLLYQLGWRGLCTHPNPNLAEKYARLRPEDAYEAVAVSNRAGKAKYFIAKQGIHTSPENSSGEEIEVETVTLQSLLQKHNAPKIDLLSINAEGAELPILESLNWEQYAPHFLLVEYNSAGIINNELQKFMIGKDYQLLFINNWNMLFTHQFEKDSKRLYSAQQEGTLFAPISAKIHPIINQEKTLQNWLDRGYVADPVISFIIQTHNRSDAVVKLVDKLALMNNTETIVIDDGSEPHHHEKLVSKLNRGNQFLLRSNDLYEVITYDRAIYLARGHLVVLLQDDDDFDGYDWISRAVTLFSEIADLVILGGRLAITPKPYPKTQDGAIGNYTLEGRHGHIDNLMAHELGTNPVFPEEFQFTPVVVRAPMWIRRSQFLEHLSHIDPSYAPFLVDDYELCLRAWETGLKVGYYPANFKIQGMGTGGMRIWNNKLTHEQAITNYRRLYAKYADKLDSIRVCVHQENETYYQ